jgi:hypothetical protein
MSTVGAWVQGQWGRGFSDDVRIALSNNYITEIMSVLRGLKKLKRSAQLPGLSSQASLVAIPWSGVVTPDQFGHHLVRNVKRKSGPSVRLVRLVSSPVRSLTMQVLTLVGVIPNPIGGIVDCRIPLADLGRLTRPKHADTTGIVCRFPAALLCHWISS